MCKKKQKNSVLQLFYPLDMNLTIYILNKSTIEGRKCPEKIWGNKGTCGQAKGRPGKAAPVSVMLLSNPGIVDCQYLDVRIKSPYDRFRTIRW